MALHVNVNIDIDDDDHTDNNNHNDTIHMTTTTTCPQLQEMDLHQVEALIVGSLTKDDRTHGCIVATTGGLHQT
jgi:hypothetical protein